MKMVQVMIGWDFPVVLCCFDDGTVMLKQIYNTELIIDQKPDGITALFDGNGFSLLEPGREWGDFQDYFYGVPYNYKEMPVLRAWLEQQELISPLEIKKKGSEDGSN